jgi:hypothetical protein
MPNCEGLPDRGCPGKRSGNGVKCCQGDLYLCKDCYDVRFNEGGSDTTTEGHNESSDDTSVKEIGDHPGENENATETNQYRTNIPTPGNKLISNPLLAYMVFALQSGTSENVKNAVLGHFTEDVIIAAKDVLWKFCGNSIIGEKCRRKDSMTRTEKEAHVQDIVSALGKLDRAEKMPHIVMDAYSLGEIP